jgi:hypothetical protein
MFAKRWGRERCSDLFGLLLLPDDENDQRQFFPIARNLTPKLRFRGSRVGWEEVHLFNLLVRADRSGRVEVTTLPRCRICERETPISPQ